MRMSEQCDKIAAAMVAIGDEVRFVGKSGNNTFDKYSYSKLDDYVRATSEALRKHRVVVVSSASSIVPLPTRKTQKGNDEHCVHLTVTMRAVHESGQWVEVDCVGEGQDRSDKATYKANTGARKYGMAQLFGLATSDDPEADESVGVDPAPQRATQAKPTTKAPGQKFMDAVVAWSGITDTKDAQSAARKVMAKAGAEVPSGGKMDEAGLQKCLAWMDQHTFEELN